MFKCKIPCRGPEELEISGARRKAPLSKTPSLFSGDMGSKSLINFDKRKIPKNPEGTDQKRGWINMIPIN
jgi:hypothetical protein